MSSLGEQIQNLREKLQSLGKKGGGGGGEGGGSAGAKFDPKQALAWVKSNPVIVASVAVMIIAPATAWWFASDIHAAEDAAASKRAQELAAIEKFEKTTVELTLPGKAPEQLVGVVNRKTVDKYKELADRLRGDAMSVQKSAMAHNQAGRNALFADIRVTRANVNTIAEKVFDAVIARGEEDLKKARAGMPPSDQSLIDQLQRRQDQFIAAERKADRKGLNDEQLARLQESLRDKRLQLYADASSTISFYAQLSDLGFPASPAEAGTPPSEAKMFHWQWRVWIIEDILAALSAANAPYRNVVDAPVKRVLSIAVREEAVAKAAAGAAPEAPADAPAEPLPEGAAAPAAPSYPAIDPKQPVSYDFTKSITGRQGNSLYDVRTASVQLIVATAMLPEVVNAISRQNFMTVTSLSVQPADAFDAADEGFIYGAQAVSEVRMTVESLWLRPWIARLMPAELQKSKGTDGKTVDDAPAEAPASEPTT